MMGEDAGGLLCSLVTCCRFIFLLAVCCASYPAFLYKREIKLCVCILERMVVHRPISRFSTLLRTGERVDSSSVFNHTLHIISCFKYYIILCFIILCFNIICFNILCFNILYFNIFAKFNI